MRREAGPPGVPWLGGILVFAMLQPFVWHALRFGLLAFGHNAACVPLRTALSTRFLWDLKSHFTRLVRSRSQPLKSPAPLVVAFAMHRSGVPLGDLKSGALVFLSPYNYAKTPGLN